MKLLTEDEADITKDVFVGMWRPPYPEITERFQMITVGEYMVGKSLRHKYLEGEFDTPLYRRIIKEKLEARPSEPPAV